MVADAPALRRRREPNDARLARAQRRVSRLDLAREERLAVEARVEAPAQPGDDPPGAGRAAVLAHLDREVAEDVPVGNEWPTPTLVTVSAPSDTATASAPRSSSTSCAPLMTCRPCGMWQPWQVSPPPARRYAAHSLYVLCMGRDVVRAAPSSKAGVENSWQSLQAVALRSSSRDRSAATCPGAGAAERASWQPRQPIPSAARSATGAWHSTQKRRGSTWNPARNSGLVQAEACPDPLQSANAAPWQPPQASDARPGTAAPPPTGS